MDSWRAKVPVDNSGNVNTYANVMLSSTASPSSSYIGSAISSS